MDAITEDVFIGNVAAANDVEALERCGVTHIISLGCEPSNRLQGAEYLAFQCILDTPETLILGILNSTDRFITAARAAHCRVLVHCVHGQSRSATVIISHLLSTGLPLEDCMRLMSERHASTCINPGFLSQLLFHASAPRDSCEYRYVLAQPALAETLSNYGSSAGDASECDSSSGSNSGGSSSSGSGSKRKSAPAPYPSDTLVCRACGGELLHASDQLSLSIDCGWVAAQQDDFWRGYRSPYPSARPVARRLPLKGAFAVCPADWMVDQVQGKNGQGSGGGGGSSGRSGGNGGGGSGGSSSKGSGRSYSSSSSGSVDVSHLSLDQAAARYGHKCTPPPVPLPRKSARQIEEEEFGTYQHRPTDVEKSANYSLPVSELTAKQARLRKGAGYWRASKWDDFTKNGRSNRYWSAQGYVVNLAMVRRFLSHVVQESNGQESNGRNGRNDNHPLL
mmetsp:Transcript_29925/g.67938  ORF Transcript_29925/g.67938 Transcript_29925/m.67938 type:complete len:451 (-) Transcript_29925:1373-2725(-)